MSLSTRSWTIFAGAMTAVVFVAGWFLLISPQRTEAADVQGQIDSVAQTVARNHAALDQLIEQAKGLPVQQKTFAHLREQIPSSQDLPGIVREVSSAAEAAHVTLTTVAPGAPMPVGLAEAATDTTSGGAGSGGLKRVDLTLSVAGNFFAVQDYLRQLEGLRRAVSVTALSVKESVLAGAKPGDVAGTISGHVFYNDGANSALPSVTALTTGSTS